MGRLSKRTIQCRAARRSRELKESKKLSHRVSSLAQSSSISSASAINFDLLCEDSLLRYQQTYGLGLLPGSSREQLVWAVKDHFQYQQVDDESSLLYGFVQALRRDNSSDSSNSTF